MCNRKGLMFSLDAMLALTLVAIAATVFVFSLNIDNTDRNRFLEVKDEIRNSEALAFMNGKNTGEMGLSPYEESIWNASYGFAACEKIVQYDISGSSPGLTGQETIAVEYMCKGVP